MRASNDEAYVSTNAYLVASPLSQLVRRRELSVTPKSEHARISPQLSDDILRPLLGEQLSECLTNFAQMASPAGVSVVIGQQLNHALAYHLFEDISVLPADRIEAELLVCAEFRRMASRPEQTIPGATLSLSATNDVLLKPAPGLKAIP